MQFALKCSPWFFESGLYNAESRYACCDLCSLGTRASLIQFKRLKEFDTYGKAVKLSEPFRVSEISRGLEPANIAGCVM